MISKGVLSQRDSSSVYTLYRLNPIVAVDFGFNTAPFNLKYKFSDPTVKTLKYRHNMKGMMGFHAAYKWFSIRVAAGLFKNMRPINLFGKSNYLDFGLQCSFKNFHGEVDYRQYYGYVLMNAKWKPDYSPTIPHDLDYNLDVHNVGLKLTYFQNSNFKMDAFYGSRGVYNKEVFTWYLLSKVDMFGVKNDSGPLFPDHLIDSTNTKTRAESLGAIEFGVMPGFGHANRVKSWQYGVLLAIGPRMQLKDYEVGGNKTTKASIVPRYDMKVMVAYTKPKYFAALHFEVDNKNINFNLLKYNQNFFSVRLQAGWRFEETSKEIRQKKRAEREQAKVQP